MRQHWTLILAAVAATTACSRQSPELDVVKASTEAPLVPVAGVTRANLSSQTVLTAEFEPFQEIEVMAKVAGYVQQIRVDIGDRVREGQLLAVLEVPEMRDDLTRAKAAIEQSQAEVATAGDELARAEAGHQMAHLSYTRIQEVARREKGLVPLQEVDEIHSRDLMAESQVAAARSKQQAAERHLAVARAEASRVETMQRYVSITAPFAGTVTKRYANTGAMVQAGTASQSQAMPLVRLSQNSVLRLRLPVPESVVASVRIGAPVEVRVNSLQRTFTGRVARTAAKVEQATRTMVTEVDVPNPESVIVPGMYAEVTLQVGKRDGVLAVPTEAVERSAAGARVYRVDAGGTVRITPVRLGIEDARRAEVTTGLGEGDRVILGARAGLSEGEKVRVRESQQEGGK